MTGAGPLRVEVNIPRASNLGDPQKKLLIDRIESFSKELFHAAETYEERSRGNSSNIRQFTTTHIADAYLEVRRSAKPSKGDRAFAFFLRLILYLAAAGIGVGGNKLDQSWV